MAAVTRPRGPLPRRVYWFRRLLVLVVAFGLVFGVARLLGASGDDPSGKVAQVAAPQPSDSGAASPTPSLGLESKKAAAKAARAEAKEERRKKRKKSLPKPDGPCLDSDVVVTPMIRTQPAYERVRVVLQIGTVESPACYWEVSPDSVFVDISDDDLGTLWTSQHCPDAVPTEDVVARQEKPARVAFFWDGLESDEECTGSGEWVVPGSYVAEAAARGSTELQEGVFVLGPGVAPTITVTATPTASEEPETGEKRDRRSRHGEAEE
ncbi:MAG TPA: hypothetical protein VFG72_07615 [Marmoricola sp.]|nr:hypothetical protein [Marmoricola sp.]